MENKNTAQPNYNDTQLQQDIENAIRANGLKKAMKHWEDDALKKAARRRHRRQVVIALFTPMAVAAMLAGVVFLGPRSWKQTINYGWRIVARQFHLGGSRTPKTPTITLNEEEFFACASSSITDVENRYQNQPLGGNSELYEIITDMESGRFKSALAQLNEIYEGQQAVNEHSYFADDVEYLKAVCEYMCGNKEAARALFNKIANSPSFHKHDAQLLLKLAN